jgi:hypothetical protein
VESSNASNVAPTNGSSIFPLAAKPVVSGCTDKCAVLINHDGHCWLPGNNREKQAESGDAEISSLWWKARQKIEDFLFTMSDYSGSEPQWFLGTEMNFALNFFYILVQ